MPNFSLPPNPASPFLDSDNITMGLVPIPTPLTQEWGIYDLNWNVVFATGPRGGNTDVGNIDSFVDLKYSNNAKVSTFPVEQGSFASYNKTGTPYAPKIGIAVGGQLRMQALMARLENELNSINLYNILTPERTYWNVTLEKYEYSRGAKAGKNLLHVTLTFMQVIEVTPNAYATTAIITHAKKPSANTVSCHGASQLAPFDASKALANLMIQKGPPPVAPGTPRTGQYDPLTWKLIL
jgi:hypothetical protein